MSGELKRFIQGWNMNYQRLDKVVASMARRDQELKPLLEGGVVEIEGVLYIRASVLGAFLGYASYASFEACISRAQVTASNSGRSVSDHFVETSLFEGKQKDLLLSLWATNATIMEADSKKKNVALVKSYFATRLVKRGKADEERLKERHIAKYNHKRLHAVADQSGVKSPLEHAVFDDAGYKAMYGMSVREVERRKGVPEGQSLLDCADYTELAANNLRMSLTADKLVEDHVRSPIVANQVHAKNGRIVRKAVHDAAGKPPEQLPLAPKTIDEIAKEKDVELKMMEH